MKKRDRQERLNDKKRVQGFNVLEDACIWMKAGVINFRKCDNAFDCSSCPFDMGMRKAMGVRSTAGTTHSSRDWAARLQASHDGAERPCRHVLTGRIDAPKICPLNYECYHCSFDQMLDDVDTAMEPESPRLTLASGYRMAEGYYYHMGHGWSRFEHGGRARLGVDDFSVKLFGSPGTLALPELGTKLKQHQPGWSFERNGRKAAVLSPVSGVVLAVNHKVVEHPEIVEADPYHEGWYLVVEPAMPKRDLKGLYFGRESSRWMEHESGRLLSMMGPEYENLAATGAEPVRDVAGAFPGIGWQVLVETFLHSGSLE